MACTKEEIEKKRLAALQRRLGKIPPNLNNRTSNNKDVTVNSAIQTFHPYSRPSSKHADNTVPISNIVSGMVYLISEDRFEVNPSEFCPPLINIFKTLNSKSYDTKSKLWNFSMKDYGEFMSKVAPLAPHIVISPLPPFVLKILNDPIIDHTSVDLSPVEKTLRNKLLPFQEEGVRFGISRRGRCLIADDMGLGKTFQALAIASYYRHNWPLLIVTTSSMRDTWQNKVHELLPSVPLMNIATITSNKDVNLACDRETEIVIVSYKMLSLHTDLMKKKKFGFVIIDESHHLKSPKAACTGALGGACGRGGAVLLSGTPALSRPAELYTQLALLQPRLLTYTEYGKRYCAGKQTSFGWDMTGQSNLAELNVVLKRFLIRRTKEEVLTDLEAKVRETVILDQSLLQVQHSACSLSAMAQKFNDSKASEKHVAMIQYFNESAAVKIPAICKYIKQLLKESSSKFLVYAHHRSVIDAVCRTLDERRTGYVCIVGATPTHARSEIVERFQSSSSCRCAVLSITAANSGLTLTAADLVIFAELHWNPGILTQAESRAHRIGRSGVVCARYLLAKGTADDYMWPLLQTKLNVLNGVGLSGDNFEDTKMKHQDSQNNILQYMSPQPKNRNDYIPSTNIRKVAGHQSAESVPRETSPGIEQLCAASPIQRDVRTERQTDTRVDEARDPPDEDLFNSFFDDDEDDDLLANMDLGAN